MAALIARAPALITRRNDGESWNRGAGVNEQSGILLKQSRRVTAYLQRAQLFTMSNSWAKCGSLVTVCGAKDMLFHQRQTGKLAGPDLRWGRLMHRPEVEESSRGASIRTNAGRNKKWRTLEKGRLEGNKRTRSNNNNKSGENPKPPRPPPVNEDGTPREPRVKPKKGPKPKERVTFAGQEMLLLNAGDRDKVGKEIQPWASVRTERMPDDYYKYGPFGPHAWKGVCVGTPRKGTLTDNLVVFFSTAENEADHEQGDIQDAITGYCKREDQMDEDVGIQYYFVFVRQTARIPGLSPWEDWTLVSQVAVESETELDKWSLGLKLERRVWVLLTRCVGWFRPDLVYVKRPGFQVRFEPQKSFLEGWVTLLNPKSESNYYPRLCELLGVDEKVAPDPEQVAEIFQGLSEEQQMECVEHVLDSHPVCLLTPFTMEAMKEEKGMMMNVTSLEDEAVEDEAGEDYNEDDEDDEVEPAFDFDEQGDDDSGNDWEREALAAEAMQDSPPPASSRKTVDDEEIWRQQALNTKEELVSEETTTEEVDAALRPFTYMNLIKEIFIIRSAFLEMAELRR